MRKSLAIVAVAAAMSIGLAGCSPSNSSSSPSKHVTLNVVGFEGGGTEIADIPTINKAFEKKYPNVTLDYKYVSNSEYDQYNNTRLASGTAADVLMTNPTRVQQWVKQGYLADLSNQSWVKNVLPNVAPFGEIKGKTYAFTQQNIPIGLYANLDILKKAGIDTVPQTWPEFVSALQNLKAANQPGLLLANQTGWTSEQISMALAASLVPNGWGPNYDKGKSTWNPAFSPVIDRVKQLLTTGLVDGKLMNGIEPFNVGNSQFIAGKWAFTVMGAWELQAIKTGAKFDFSLNPMPGGAAGTKPKSFTFVGSGWGVNAASPNQTAAKEYVAFMTDPKNDGGYLAAENSFSTLKNVPSPTMPNAASFVQAFNDGRTTPSPIEFIQYPTYEQQFWNVGTSLFNDPTQSDSSLLSTLDKTIPKTK
ncbi:MAG: raffinose/stachyose/melibiose transport system substrate-binding protein [Microbacteriaceae bacterium]|nr:raffinose/stachyose/melibiose transport system substrate-binding protein [Microbacteriaceae bacterium]